MDKVLDNITFTLPELEKVFTPFLERLVNDHGNDRQAMIDYHLTKLVGIPYKDVKKKMPRGPKGRWYTLMFEVKVALRLLAIEKYQLTQS